MSRIQTANFKNGFSQTVDADGFKLKTSTGEVILASNTSGVILNSSVKQYVDAVETKVDNKTLAQVLTSGADANGASITNLNGISSKSNFDLTLSASNGKKIIANSDINMGSKTLTVGSISTQGGTTINNSVSVTGTTNSQNLNVVGTTLTAGTLTVNDPIGSTVTITGNDGKVECKKVSSLTDLEVTATNKVSILQNTNFNSKGIERLASITLPQSITPPTAGQVLASSDVNGTLFWRDVSTSGSGGGAFTGLRTLYVASNNTVSGDGSINNPYQTIVSAVAFAEANYNTANQWIIFVYAGSYSGFTLTKGRIQIIGVDVNSPYSLETDAPCKITTEIRISLNTTGSSLTSNIISLSNFLLLETNIVDSNVNGFFTPSNDPYTLYLTNVQIRVDTTPSASGLININNQQVTNVFLSNCRLTFSATSVSGSSLFTLNSPNGKANIRECVFNTSQNVHCVSIMNTSQLELLEDSICNNNLNNASVLDIIRITSNLSTVIHTIRNSTISYTTTIAKNSGTRAILCGTGSGVNIRVHLVNNHFSLRGCAPQNCFVAGDNNNANAGNRVHYSFNNNTVEVGTANSIQGNLGESKYALVTVA